MFYFELDFTSKAARPSETSDQHGPRGGFAGRDGVDGRLWSHDGRGVERFSDLVGIHSWDGAKAEEGSRVQAVDTRTSG